MFKVFFISIIAVIISSCSQMQTKLDPLKIYKMDISITNKEFNAVGMLVLPAKPLYTIEFEADQKINFISFRTCSRETTSEDPSSGLSRRKFSINYRPNEIEATGNCPTIISAYNTQGMYSVGFIDYEHVSANLPAENVCGAKTERTSGVSVCQERVSSIERIKFDVDVLTSPDIGCELESGTRGKEFTYKIKRGYCTYGFMETREPYRIHRLTTYGYDDVQVRL